MRYSYQRTLLVVGLALTIAACNSSQPQGNVTSGPASEEATTIRTVAEETFTPNTLQLPAGQEVTIEITNDDGEAHDFAIEALDINTGTIEPGGIATATFTVPTGTTPFVCTFHNGMGGAIEGV